MTTPTIAGIGVRPRTVPVSGREPFAVGERMQGMVDRMRSAATTPFVGVTRDGSIEPGLFPVAPSGVSTEPLRRAAGAFLDALSDDQRAAVTLPLDSPEWRTWSNISPFLLRHGLLLEALDRPRRELALNVLRAASSRAGYASARDVMKLNETIAEITGRANEYGEWLYWLSLFGAPSATEPWGWQIDGHHLIVNCLVLGDQLVLTPQFLGSEPVLAESGVYAGTRVFQVEEERGFALMRALSDAQRDVARVGMQLPGDVLGTAGQDNLVLDYAGLPASDLSGVQRELLLGLITTYVGRWPAGHDAVRLAEISAHLDRTYFAWIGPCDDARPFYYRVHSPVVLIEFDHLPGVALDNDAPTRNHIHTIVRTPNGNDYGKDLLRQHYATAAHHQR